MLLPLFLGFLLGAVAVVAAEGAILLLALRWLRRGKRRPEPETEDRDAGQPIPLRNAKKGIIWVLEPEKIQKVSTDESSPRLPKEQKNKDIVEVFPVKKYARIKDHSLILTDVDGSEGTIELHNCTIVAVSASNLSSRKWAKRYPIKLESKTSLVYNRSKVCYLYLETSWEKESWCKELRLASCVDKKKKIWYAQLIEEFHAYLVALNSEYPSFLKSSALFGAYTDRANKIDGPSSKVRLFLKKIAKKASKTTTESRPSSTTPSTHDERKNGENLPSSQDVSRNDGFVKSPLKNSLPSASMQDLVQSSSPTPDTLENISQNSTFPDAVCNEKFVYDEGTLCWNLLFSRLFFDAKRKIEINDGIKARIQKTLSNMRTPSYIGGVICTGLDLGNLPPYIHKMRVLPIGLNEVWAVEVDIEYLGGILLDFETRIGVCEPELQDDIMKTSPEPSSAGELTSDLLDGIEHYGNQLKSSNNSMDRTENTDEGKAEPLKQSKSSRWASTYISRWKTIKQSFADQVSQVPLSLAVRVASLRGTLRLHIKPPPSDQLWFGFTSMPEIDWNFESSIGDRKITNAHVALLIGNRFKAAIRETLVLPNCEGVCIPFMIAEKDDWVPRTDAPYIWVNQDSADKTEIDPSNSHHSETKSKNDSLDVSKAGSTPHLDDEEVQLKNVIHVQEQPCKPHPEILTSQEAELTSVISRSSTSEDLRRPLLRADSRPESPGSSRSGSVMTLEDQMAVHSAEDLKQNKLGKKARMMSLGKKMGEKFEEKRRHLEEKSRLIVEKMRENTKD